MIDYIQRHIDWSLETFGEGAHTAGLIKHIKKELKEISAAPADLLEWIDIIILGIDGAWRSGHTAQEIAEALCRKQCINMYERDWPESFDEDEPIEHIKED